MRRLVYRFSRWWSGLRFEWERGRRDGREPAMRGKRWTGGESNRTNDWTA